MGEHCCLLKKLSLVDLPQLTGAGLQQLLEDHFRANQLLHLQVSRCEKVRGWVLIARGAIRMYKSATVMCTSYVRNCTCECEMKVSSCP